MIPQFQQLKPLESNLSGDWRNPTIAEEQNSLTSKVLLSPIGSRTSAIHTDSIEKYSNSKLPTENLKVERNDSSYVESTGLKQETKPIYTNPMIETKPMKTKPNFTIEYLLSTNFSPPVTFAYSNMRKTVEHGIFDKKKVKHFTEQFLDRAVHRTEKIRRQSRSIEENRSFLPPKGIFMSYIFDVIRDFIDGHKRIKCQQDFFKIDALEQLAEIACKIDTRQQQSIFDDEKLTIKTYQKLMKQSISFIKTIRQKNQKKKFRKRLSNRSKFGFNRHMLYFATYIRNLLEKKRKFISDQSEHSNCQVSSVSDNEKQTEPCCSYIIRDQIVTDLEILLPNGGLVYEATIQTIEDCDDLFLIRLNHERKTYVIPTVDLCRLACPKIVPTDFEILKKNRRVCALWSTSLRGLHPAVVKTFPDNDQINDSSQSPMISLVFDDGDTGLIKLDEIRLLPNDFKIEGILLDEWLASSFQIPKSSTLLTRKSRMISRSSTRSTSISTRNVKQPKNSRKPSKPPQWTLNTRNSTITRGDKKEVLRKGDCIILHGANQSLSYIGKVLKFYKDRETQQDLVRLKWYYSPKETPQGQNDDDLDGALYESTHIDVNPVATIRSKGIIYQSYDDYVKKTNYGKQRQDNDFYIVGHYDPTSGVLQRYDNRSKA